MEELKMGGFPPLIKKNKNIKIDLNQKELKPQFFSTVQRNNINIREILSEKQKNLQDNLNYTLEEIDSI